MAVFLPLHFIALARALNGVDALDGFLAWTRSPWVIASEIALVFALFQLNPAPFCLLDEVDAPLDDPNTDRFCAMVRTMAEGTQFLFISHNKITMEMAEQLIGITMPDPGVSRVVAVDIAEALELAESLPRQAAAGAR